MERQIQRMTWTKVKYLVPDSIKTVLLPIGTMEAHGSAALGTDNFIPQAIAESQAQRLNALIAPVLNYGITKSLYQYPGSMTIQPQHFAPFVTDILNSLVDCRFKYIIVLNGHGGNNSALKQAAYDIHYRRGTYIAVIHWWMLIGDLTVEHFGQAGGHAGLDETACVQAIDPALVDKDEYNDKMAWQMRPGSDVYPSPGSVLLYKEGEGEPNFDYQQAKTYLPKVCEAVGDYILEVIEQWKQLD